KQFFGFVREEGEAGYVHWNMRGPNFGFDVLAQRARRYGVEVADIPAWRRLDLANHLKVCYGDDYVPHPRLLNALRANGLLGPEVLTKEAAATAWARREHNRLIDSLSSKVDGI